MTTQIGTTAPQHQEEVAQYSARNSKLQYYPDYYDDLQSSSYANNEACFSFKTSDKAKEFARNVIQWMRINRKDVVIHSPQRTTVPSQFPFPHWSVEKHVVHLKNTSPEFLNQLSRRGVQERNPSMSLSFPIFELL